MMKVYVPNFHRAQESSCHLIAMLFSPSRPKVFHVYEFRKFSPTAVSSTFTVYQPEAFEQLVMGTGRSELDTLQVLMNTSIDAIRQELAAGGLPSLSSRTAERHPMDDPSFLPSPRLFEARRLAIACIVGIQSFFAYDPFIKLCFVVEQSFAPYHTASIDVLLTTGLIDYMGSLPNVSAGVHADELGERFDLDPRKLTTILRFLSTNGWVSETTESVFVLNRPALELVEGRDGRACAEFPREAQVSAVLQDWITHKDWRHSQSASETAKQFAVAVQAIGNCYSPGVLADYPWRSLPPTQTLVDCGGGQGAFSIALSKVCPSNKFIIQDLEGVVSRAEANVKAHIPGALESGRITVEAHDFFTPMPHHGDGYSFIFRHILHDWPGDRVIEILTQIAKAVGPKSKVLILENITRSPASNTNEYITLDDLSDTNEYKALSVPYHIPWDFGASGQTQQGLALAIMGILNSQERTLTQWTKLIEAANLRVTGVFPLRATLSVIECCAAERE
ncbi:O-methyltransferase 7 [Grifola frondosa]|uniref:O-methyltransferase 7 n=1 Tax=Grifola frondosa TaxID=5627 RepID=A0A1C7LYB6_GRIFR|nr:O-methyltransferase 7 [Grifola frondosa]